MGIKSLLVKPIARYITKHINKNATNAVAIQHTLMKQLLQQAKNTQFGREHNFSQIKTYQDFCQNVPLRDYEDLRNYVNQIINGQSDVLWPGKPLYFAKTSGTTSGVKYIPITKQSIGNHFNTARNALFAYVAETGNAQFFDGKMIFLSGSPVLDKKGGINTGRLSGIVNHHIPSWLRTNQLPDYQTNCIEDWEQKVNAIADITLTEDMRLISGIPPWMQMYFDVLQEKSTGKLIKDIFTNLQVIVFGGVNFEPYRAKLEKSIGKKIATVETYPASEGFIAYQNTQNDEGLLLNTNSGIFFEFVPANEIHNPNPTRLSLADVQLNENYALIINSNAGLWGYIIGDTIKFVSKKPHKIVVSGRIKHFISAFGEHVIVEEVEHAITQAAALNQCEVIEFTVAPSIKSNTQNNSYHEWLVAFSHAPKDVAYFSDILDKALQEKNIYYADLRAGNILGKPKVQLLPQNAFQQYMKSIGKLGGQNKVPRLSNDRKIADALLKYS